MRPALIVAVAMTMAPVAMAQTVCEEVAAINAAGLHRFDSIRGGPATDEPENEHYESNATLFGLETCLIEQVFEPRHGCVWEFDTETELIAAYAARSDAVAPCFEGWERTGLLVTDPNDPGYRVIAGVGYLGAGPFAVLVWEIVASLDPDREAGGRYRLSISAIDYTL